jgi:hypothetical protein
MMNDLGVLACHDVLPVDCVLETQQSVVEEHDIAIGDFYTQTHTHTHTHARTHADKHSTIRASISHMCVVRFIRPQITEITC